MRAAARAVALCDGGVLAFALALEDGGGYRWADKLRRAEEPRSAGDGGTGRVALREKERELEPTSIQNRILCEMRMQALAVKNVMLQAKYKKVWDHFYSK